MVIATSQMWRVSTTSLCQRQFLHVLRVSWANLTSTRIFPMVSSELSEELKGFHSDFRGPFSAPTPQGYLYLLTIVDDFSRRIFGFLTKCQTEWMDIWTKFVVRIEAEIGQPN